MFCHTIQEIIEKVRVTYGCSIFKHESRMIIRPFLTIVEREKSHSALMEDILGFLCFKNAEKGAYSMTYNPEYMLTDQLKWTFQVHLNWST